MYQHILVPFDDSQAALVALVEACKVGRLTGGTLHIVHASYLTSCAICS